MLMDGYWVCNNCSVRSKNYFKAFKQCVRVIVRGWSLIDLVFVAEEKADHCVRRPDKEIYRPGVSRLGRSRTVSEEEQIAQSWSEASYGDVSACARERRPDIQLYVPKHRQPVSDEESESERWEATAKGQPATDHREDGAGDQGRTAPGQGEGNDGPAPTRIDREKGKADEEEAAHARRRRKKRPGRQVADSDAMPDRNPADDEYEAGDPTAIQQKRCERFDGLVITNSQIGQYPTADADTVSGSEKPSPADGDPCDLHRVERMRARVSESSDDAGSGHAASLRSRSRQPCDSAHVNSPRMRPDETCRSAPTSSAAGRGRGRGSRAGVTMMADSGAGGTMMGDSGAVVSKMADSGVGVSMMADSRAGGTMMVDSRAGVSMMADSRAGVSVMADSRAGVSAMADSRAGVSSAMHVHFTQADGRLHAPGAGVRDRAAASQGASRDVSPQRPRVSKGGIIRLPLPASQYPEHGLPTHRQPQPAGRGGGRGGGHRALYDPNNPSKPIPVSGASPFDQGDSYESGGYFQGVMRGEGLPQQPFCAGYAVPRCASSPHSEQLQYGYNTQPNGSPYMNGAYFREPYGYRYSLSQTPV